MSKLARLPWLRLALAVCGVHLLSTVANSQEEKGGAKEGFVDRTITVPGNAGSKWVDTGIDVPSHTVVQLWASGVVNVGKGITVGPEGTEKFANGLGYPADTRLRYGLVARITQSRTNPADELKEDWELGRPGEYGVHERLGPNATHCPLAGGHLWLTVNDDDPADNTGEFVVRVFADPTFGTCSPQLTINDCGGSGNGSKACDGRCVATDLPQYGCSSSDCVPCYVPHAQAGCRSAGNGRWACAVRTCNEGWTNKDGDDANGCELGPGR